MERNNIVEKKAVRRPRRVLEYWRGLILNLKTNYYCPLNHKKSSPTS